MTNKRRNKDKRRRRRRRERAAPTYKAANRSPETAPCAEPEDSATIKPSAMTKRLDCRVAKVDDTLGVVFGWAIISTEDGFPYVDTQGDYIPDSAMLKAATKFAKGKRQGGDMHHTEDGVVLFMFPLTAEVAKAFDIDCDKTGLMIGMAPDNPETLEKFRTGERTGFSIGGKRVVDTPREMEVEA